MNGFSLEKVVIRMPVADRCLPLNIDADRAGFAAVLGGDIAKVANVAYRMSLFQPCEGGWHRNTFRELAWPETGDIPLSTAEYSRLLSQVRKDLTADLMSVHGNRGRIPVTERILEHRLRPIGSPNWLGGPGERVFTRADEILADFETVTIDNFVTNMVSAAPFPNYRNGSFFEHFTLVAILSEKMTDAEHRLLAHYVAKAKDVAPRVKIYIVVEDAASWKSFCVRPEWAAWTGLAPITTVRWPEQTSNRFQLGRVHWSKSDLDTQIKRLGHLLKKIICDGGQFSDVTVVTQDFPDALVLRHKLMAAGIPVKTSESYLLPMRPQIFTLISLLGVARGCGRLQGVSRMMEVWPELNLYGLKPLHNYFERHTDDSTETENGPFEFRNALQPLAQFTSDQPVSAWIEGALLAFERLPKPCGHELMLENARALCEWGREFTTPDELLTSFWRLRALYSDWDGFRTGLGVTVTSKAKYKYVENEIAVVFQTEGFTNDTIVAAKDVFIAPLAVRGICGPKLNVEAVANSLNV